MPLDAAAVAWLRTDAGARATAEAEAALAEGISTLAILDRLRRTVEADEARHAMTLAEGRRTAAAKFEDAGRLYFDRESAEQATGETVAQHTARRFAGATRIADLGCGAGADAMALAAQAEVVAIDIDPGRAALAEANAAAGGLRVRTAVADYTALHPDDGVLAGADAAWLDPGRRDTSGRVLDPERWSPPLSVALRIASHFPRAGIKVAPGIDLGAVPEGAEIEFISLHGTLVEAVIWTGAAVMSHRRATVLPAGESIAGEADRGGAGIGEPGAYLYDLDPAVGRASLVDLLAPRLHAQLLSEGVGYLTGDECVWTPFARVFRVLAWAAFSERWLVEASRSAGATRVDVMRRASPVDTNALELRVNRALGTSAGQPTRVLTVALTRCRGEHIAILCERLREAD